VGKRFSENPRTRAEIEAYAHAMADMFCAYFRALEDGCEIATRSKGQFTGVG
jgi:hypothetical protein